MLPGAAALLWAVDGFTALPTAVAEERGFASAVPCTAAGAHADQADCLRTVRATVTGTVIQSSGREQTYRLELSGPAPASGSLDTTPLVTRI